MNQAKQLRVAAKARAKMLLFSNLGKCIAVSLIVSAIGILGGLVSSYFVPVAEDMIYDNGTINMVLYTSSTIKTAVIAIILSFISCPLAFGMYEFFINLVRNNEVSVVDIFNWFGEGSRFIKAIGANLWYMLISLGWSLLFELVPIILLILLTLFADSISLPIAMIIYVFCVVLILVGAVFALIQSQYYTVAIYMIAGDPSRKVRETFRECKALMKSRKWEFFVLNLSFIGWQLLAAFTCGLSVVFVTPYMNITFAAYTEHILAVNNYASQPNEESGENNINY